MSFANEVRDFLNSYTAMREQGGRAEDRRLRREEIEANRAYRDAMLELRREEGRLNRAARTARESLVGDDGLTPYQRETLRLRELEVNNRAAAAAETAAEEADAAIDTSAFDEDPDLFAVPNYQQGGLVADEEVSEALPLGTQPTPLPQATPAVGSAPAPAPAPAPAAPATMPEPSPEATSIIVRRARDATGAALDEFERQFNTPPAAIGEGSQAPEMDPVSGEGGMTPQEVEAVRQAVDPNNTIPSHMRGTAALAELYTHHLERGDTASAVRAAKGFLIGELNATRTLGNLALEAFRNGDVASACRLFNDACNRFPSGHEITVEPDQRGVLTYTIRNEGEVVEQGRINSQQFLEQATGVANGSLFLRSAAQFVADNDTRSASPERALDVAIDARLAAEAAVEALEAAMDNGVRGAELRQLQEAAQEAQSAFTEARGAAISAGNSRTDVDAAFTQALRVRTPEVPSALLEDPEPGPFRRAIDAVFGGDEGGTPAEAPNEFSALPDTAAGAAPAAPAPVTPEGNTTGLSRPTTRQEYDALPSGTRFVAPDGSVRVKP